MGAVARFVAVAAVLCACVVHAHAAVSHVSVTRSPVDTSMHRVAWQHTAGAGERGIVQEAYRVVVFARDALGLPVWDSGHIISPAISHVIPRDALLPSRAYAVQVTAWSTSSLGGSEASSSSAREQFLTGPDPRVWDAANSSWIGGANQLRSQDVVLDPQRTIEQAVAHVSGLGQFVFFVNGERVGDHVMDPGQSAFDRRVFFVSFDITSMLAPGARNVFGAFTGNGKYGYLDVWCNVTLNGGPDGCRTFRMVAEILFTDGKSSPSRHSSLLPFPLAASFSTSATA
jgi:hypothetical protein